MELECRTIDEIKAGDSAQLVRKVTLEDIFGFAGVTGDINPVHVDRAFAAGSMFKGQIAHGMFTASLISAVLAGRLPGVGTIYLGQTLKFLAPVRPGDEVTAGVEVLSVDREKGKVVLATVVTNQDDKKVLVGEATVLAPREKPEGF